MVPEGGSAKLVCKARGYPKPDIVWKREDGSEIISRAGLSGGKTKSKGKEIIDFFLEYKFLFPFSFSLIIISDIIRASYRLFSTLTFP